uniref:Uncharacterized protein n=1 Tax=viral metagenome TaxID=1070528 RepID=A0A6M3IGD0_9ZZZZ
MKRLTDYDEYNQALPKNKRLLDRETGRTFITGAQYADLGEFLALKTLLEETIEVQNNLLEQMRIELVQIKLHLAAMSNEPISEEDVDDR